LPSATLRLRQAGYGLCPVPVSKYRASPISSRAVPGTQPYPSADPKGLAALRSAEGRRYKMKFNFLPN
jgi:hypothetical protein